MNCNRRQLYRLPPRDLEDHKVVMFANGYYHTQLLRQYFEAEGVQPDLLLQTSQLSTVNGRVYCVYKDSRYHKDRLVRTSLFFAAALC